MTNCRNFKQEVAVIREQFILISPGDGELARYLTQRMLGDAAPPFMEWKKSDCRRDLAQCGGIQLAGTDGGGRAWYWVGAGKSAAIVHLSLTCGLQLCDQTIGRWQIYRLEEEAIADQPLQDIMAYLHLEGCE